MKIHPLITDSRELAALCERLSEAPFIAVDTEFMRESTYWPILCLIQIADQNEAAAIDPLAKDIDLTPLMDLLTNNKNVLKVVHAGGQDLEIICKMTGTTPHPLFDTQIAAMAIGQAEQVGYANLVDGWLGIQLDKGARFTDWSRRPLDARQIEYAIADVTHLSTIFPMMIEKLKETDRGWWLNDEMERLADPTNYVTEPADAWRRVKFQSRNPEALGRLKALAAWREKEAQRKDMPRGRIMKDETLADVATHPPREQAGLAKVRGLSAAWAKNDIGERVMQALERAEPLSKDEIPSRSPRTPGLGKEGALVADLLKLLLKIRSREMNVASKLITRAGDLDALAAGERDGLDILAGWRFEVFGKDALELVEGRMGFTVRNGRMVMSRTEVEDDEPS
ncbi:ribonuclease D [Sphingorhabdus soli]|uniref:Ribonuclease D n=1 Tax=Flavisphingopyxis soli TaxID=2601267 RepID=A0A5C6U9T4_9SPHN|nr:ribonuclease D [Sphingorhabdus soli]TXC68951.1 ribonuclease D [Sphingorhabdus soli]